MQQTFKNEQEYFISLDLPREKPVVHCTVAYGDIKVGQRAHVFPRNHVAEYLNGELAHTSTVLSYDAEMGEFSTKNTKYVIVENHPMHGAL